MSAEEKMSTYTRYASAVLHSTLRDTLRPGFELGQGRRYRCARVTKPTPFERDHQRACEAHTSRVVLQ
jgi:hypothetical protein